MGTHTGDDHTTWARVGGSNSDIILLTVDCCSLLLVKPSPVASSKEEYTLDILKQPERSIQGVQGEPLRLEIIVRGHPPPTYQWYKDTVALPYATSAVLEIESMSASSEGEYCCSVTNALGSKLSARCTVQALLPRPLRRESLYIEDGMVRWGGGGRWEGQVGDVVV